MFGSATRPPMSSVLGLPAVARSLAAIAPHVRLALVTSLILLCADGCQTVRGTLALTEAAIAAQSDQAWLDEAYRVGWEEAHVPQEAAANVVLAVPVTLRNRGNRIWPTSQVFVAYHWFRDHKLVVWDGVRTHLPRDLEPGGRATLSARVKTPAESGSYVLQITLVQELVTWFENKGATTIFRPIVVLPPTASVDCGISGSTTCTAAH
jgi:hypothetical protein